jgi:hypothetical protein
LSARIRRPVDLRVVVGFQRGDAPVQVAQDLLVHLGQTELPVGGGSGQQPVGLLAMLAVLVQELWDGDEHRAGQAGFSELK